MCEPWHKAGYCHKRAADMRQMCARTCGFCEGVIGRVPRGDAETLRAEDLPTLGRGGSQQPAQDDLDALDLKAYVRVHTVKLERSRIQRALDVEDGEEA